MTSPDASIQETACSILATVTAARQRIMSIASQQLDYQQLIPLHSLMLQAEMEGRRHQHSRVPAPGGVTAPPRPASTPRPPQEPVFELGEDTELMPDIPEAGPRELAAEPSPAGLATSMELHAEQAEAEAEAQEAQAKAEALEAKLAEAHAKAELVAQARAAEAEELAEVEAQAAEAEARAAEAEAQAAEQEEAQAAELAEAKARAAEAEAQAAEQAQAAELAEAEARAAEAQAEAEARAMGMDVAALQGGIMEILPDERDEPPVESAPFQIKTQPMVRGASAQVRLMPVGMDSEDESIEDAPIPLGETLESAGDGEGFGITAEAPPESELEVPPSIDEDSVIEEGDGDFILPHPEHGQDQDQEQELEQSLQDARRLVESGRMGEAVQFFNDVLDRQPDHRSAHLERGNCFLELGDYGAAMSDFRKAEELSSDDVEPLVAIGSLYYARKEYERAIEHFSTALQRKHNHAMALCKRGISYFYLEEYRRAFLDLQKAQKLDSSIQQIDRYKQMAINRMNRNRRRR